MKKQLFFFLLPFVWVLFSGCTATDIKKLDASHQVTHVYIRENPKVKVPDFVEVVREGFSNHGISTEMIPPEKPSPQDAYIMTYTARRSWDFARYLSIAQLDIEQNGEMVAQAKYWLRGKGGFSLFKWQGVRTKMMPVIDELLADYPRKK